MTPLGLLSFCLLQWFGVRLSRIVLGGAGPEKTVGWGLYVGVLPLSGWWFGYIGPSHFIRLTRER